LSESTQARLDIEQAEVIRNPSSCPECGHPPVFHEKTLRGSYCIICVYAQAQVPIIKVCKQEFKFNLSPQEREQATKACRDAYPQGFISMCANCGSYWEQHHGFLCPTGDSIFVLLIL
jgi:hypothetical protein